MALGASLGAEMRFYENIKNTQGQTGIYEASPSFSREELVRFWEESSEDVKREIKDIALFQERKGKRAENEDLGRSEKVKLIETAGNMNLVTPDRLMSGSYAAADNKKGCVISRKTADTLFGTEEAVGEVLKLEKDIYKICGIVDIDSQLCMVQGREGTLYSAMRIEAPGIPVSVVKGRLAGMVSQEQWWISECDLYLGIGNVFLYLPAWVLFFQILFRVRREAAGNVRLLIPICGFGGFCALLLVSFHFSDDYIPSAWSDFSFFTRLFHEKTEDFLTLIRKPLFYADSVMLGSLAGAAAAGVLLAGMLFCYTRKYLISGRIIKDFPDETPQSLQARRRLSDRQGCPSCISSFSVPGGWWRWLRYRAHTRGRRP